MNTPEQQLNDECEAHVVEYIAHLEEALRELLPAPKVDMRIIPAPHQSVFARSEQTGQATFSLRS